MLSLPAFLSLDGKLFAANNLTTSLKCLVQLQLQISNNPVTMSATKALNPELNSALSW